MTRRSRRELERALDDLDGNGSYTLADYLWADLKDYYAPEEVSSGERRLLDDPPSHMKPLSRAEDDVR